MTNEAIILAGGFGTRLASVVDVPKPMAPINDIPFLEYLLNYLSKYNITKVHLALGYKHEVISTYFGATFKAIKLNYVIEDTPLGTGGAIKKALIHVESEAVFIINGDTFFDVDLLEMGHYFDQKEASVMLALKPMQNFDRYGVVELNEEDGIWLLRRKNFVRKAQLMVEFTSPLISSTI